MPQGAFTPITGNVWSVCSFSYLSCPCDKDEIPTNNPKNTAAQLI